MYIKEKLEKLNFKTITPIQEGVFKYFHEKKHLVGVAPTGTGKTHAYLLPILANLSLESDYVEAIIIVPTNELVLQVERMLKEVDDTKVVKTYYGSIDKQREERFLKTKQPQIVISTPQKLNEFVFDLKILNIHKAKYVVFDEADMMFDYDFLSLIDPLLNAFKDSKLFFFSATITKEMKPFLNKYFGNHRLIDTTKEHKLKIKHKLIYIKEENRLEILIKTINTLNPYLCFIFVSKKETQEAVFNALSELNLNIVNLNASLGVKKRKAIIDDIIKLKYQYVVTSDLAARGLDFKISHVINYNLPYMLEFFFHRAGRTGRMNDTGTVITLASDNEHRKISKLKDQGIHFRLYSFKNDLLVEKPIKANLRTEAEMKAIKKIKKPSRVSPNYKKKNKAKILKLKKELRRKEYAKNR